MAVEDAGRIREHADMQDVGIASATPPEVYRPDGSPFVYLRFRGLRDANVADRDYRVRITLPLAEAAELWQRLTHIDGVSPTAE